jgi:hypothetical protein
VSVLKKQDMTKKAIRTNKFPKKNWPNLSQPIPADVAATAGWTYNC